MPKPSPIIVDTREPVATAWVLPGREHSRGYLDFGDYALAEFVDIAWRPDRKMLTDACSSFVMGSDRINAAIARAKDAKITLTFIIEGCLADLATFPRFTPDFTEKHVRGKIKSMIVRGASVLWAAKKPMRLFTYPDGQVGYYSTDLAVSRADAIALAADLFARTERHCREAKRTATSFNKQTA